MDLYIKLLIGISIPFAFLTLFTVFRLLKTRRNLQKVSRVTIPPETSHDIVLKTCQEYAVSLDMEDSLSRLLEYLKGSVSVSAISFLIPTSEGSSDYIFKSHLLYEVAEAFVNSDLSALREYAEKNLGASVQNIDRRVDGGPLNSSSTVKALSRVIFPIEAGDFKGAISLSSRRSGHFSGLLEKDLQSLFSLCSTYFTLLSDVAQKEHRKFKSMVDSMRDGVFMVDEEYRFLIVNPAIKEMLGLHEAETVNIVRVSSFFSTRFSVEDVISEVFALGKIKIVDNILLNDQYYHLSAIPVKVRDSITGVVCLVHNDTPEKELEKMKRDFSAMIIHELRSPLSVIRGTSDFLLKEEKNLDIAQKESFLAQIKDSSDRLLKLVNDLLDSAKIESGNIELFKSEVDLNKLTSEVVDYYAKSAEQKKIALSVDLAKDMPTLQADADKLRQVLNNLISNGLKYTDEGGEVRVSTKKEDSSLRLLVADTGKGIEDVNKELIFQKYKQMEYAKTTEKRTGLGLAISKGIVDAHNGKIWVENNAPKGSVFIVELPL